MYCLGIYNGVKGTIVGFVFESSTSYDYSTDTLDVNGNPK